MGGLIPPSPHHTPLHARCPPPPPPALGERPIGAAKGKQTNTMASCQPHRPLLKREHSKERYTVYVHSLRNSGLLHCSY